MGSTIGYQNVDDVCRNSLRFKRKLASIAVAVSILGGCNNSDRLPDTVGNIPEQGTEQPKLSGAEIDGIKSLNIVAILAKDLASEEERVKRALENVLFDPSSAIISRLRFGKLKGSCGKLNAKNRFGAYVGFRDFVFPKDGKLLLSNNSDGIASVWTGEFAEAYKSECASKAEIDSVPAPERNSEFGPESDYSAKPSLEPEQEPDRVLDAAPDSSLPDDLPTT